MTTSRLALLLVPSPHARARARRPTGRTPRRRADAAPLAFADAGAGDTNATPEPDGGRSADAGADASLVAPDGELTLEVRAGYCPPGTCRSYTLALRADGRLRGGKRKSEVPAAEVTALFDLAASAFAAPHTCIPNAPDRQSQSITFRSRGTTQTARGGCGARLEDLKTRLEKLAAAD